MGRMPNIKLTYFDLRARAEPCRLLLAYAGAKYKDERLPAPWDNMAPWAALKPNTPWGQVPLLAWDGEVIAQCAQEWRWPSCTRSLMSSKIFSMLGTPSTMLWTLQASRSSWRQTSPQAWGSWRRSWRAEEGSSWLVMHSPGLIFISSSM